MTTTPRRPAAAGRLAGSAAVSLALALAVGSAGCRSAPEARPDEPPDRTTARPPPERPVPAPSPAPPPAPEAAPAKPSFVQVGLASYYHDGLAGRLTASGEPYRPEKATCAHRTLPFGTVVRIEVLDTGATVRCRVNDRGPFVKGRIIDVSKALARRLGLLKRGVAKVRLTAPSQDGAR